MASWRILVVDDEPEIQEVVTEFLEGLGHHVDAFASGRQAIERLAGELSPYDIALVDWTMPGISGRDVINEIQRRSPHTAIIVATGRMDLTPPPGLNLLEVPVLKKPFQLRKLSEALDRVMNRPPKTGSTS